MGTDPKTLAKLIARTNVIRARKASSSKVVPKFDYSTKKPCRYRGEEVRGAERQKLGLSHFRTWAPCLHPEKPLGEYVCPCKGCNATCRGYSPGRNTDSQTSDAPEPLSTPLPPYKKLTWSYGVTTVPDRRDDLLPITLGQLTKAGFDAPRLFVDGANDAESWHSEFNLPVTMRHPRVRAYANWVLSLVELYLREPLADRYAIFQDDFVTCYNLREYLDRCPYPAGGYLNLFTFMGNEELAPGYPRPEPGWYKSNQFGRGAVALVFDRDALRTLLMNQHAAGHFWARAEDEKRGYRAIDGGVVTALKKAGVSEYVHHPSLVQHVGERSVIGNRPHPDSKTFAGERADALDFLPRV